jgi:hypothetical protein
MIDKHHVETISLSFLKLPCIPWLDSISRPTAPVSSVSGGDDATRSRNQGRVWFYIHMYVCIEVFFKYSDS